MNITTLRARAAKKRARIEKQGDTFRVIDTQNDEVIATVEGLPALEDTVAWLDKV